MAATLFHKIQALYTDIDLNAELDKDNVVIQNDMDGSGEYIKTWNVSGKSKPTTSQLNGVASDAETLLTNIKVKKTRKISYGNLSDQLDEIYHDIDAWKTRIKKVKDDNPKS
jgi:gas vesicle protein